MDDLGELLLGVPETYPALQNLLPRMASDEIQLGWTGSSGKTLLAQSLAFVRALEAGAQRHGGKALSVSVILDYGCGWGRLLRLMLKHAPPERLYGVDPWDRSIDICRADGVLGRLAQSEYLPDALPFEGVSFDLIYAFSVFTHLSRRAADTALAALRRRIAPDGLLVVTIRPVEYWRHHTFSDDRLPGRVELEALHEREGFAFKPHNRPPVDGDITYGDTTISLDVIRREWRAWRLVDTQLNAADPFQRLVFLKPA